MNKKLVVVVALVCLTTPALAQVRPQDCAPVFPVVDKVAEVLPQDVTTAQAGPAQIAKKKGFFGLPLLPLLLGALGAGGVAAASGGGGATPVVSPA